MRIRPLLIALILASTAAHADDEPSPRARCDSNVEKLLAALDAADYGSASGAFDGALRERFSAEKLKQDLAVPASYGKAMGRGRPHSGAVNGQTLVLTPLIYEHATLTAEIRCGMDGALTDFKVQATQVMSTP